MTEAEELLELQRMTLELEAAAVELRGLRVGIQTMRAAHDQVLARHRPYTHGEPACHECGKAFPCPTVADLGYGL